MVRSGRAPDVVRGQLQRILASPGFASAPRLSEFLRFIVEETIEGRGGDIKEYVIGTRVYRKGAMYDTRLDATVRVEAHKLRSRLLEYYANGGRRDRVIISIPKGSYVPSFAPRSGRQRAAFSFLARLWWIPAALGLVAISTIWIDRFGSGPPPVTRPFATYPGGAYEPAFSPEGRRLAFVWNGSEQSNFDIYVRAVDGDTLTRLTSDPAPHGSPVWSPDGSHLAFLRYGESPILCGVYSIPVTGGPERKVAAISPLRDIYDRHLDWAPRGDVIAFADRGSAEEPFSIYTVSPTNGTRRRITNPPRKSKGDTGPVFSPDGRFICFRRTISAGVNDIFVVASDGGAERRLTSDNRFTSAHAWTPRGGEIVFSSNRGGALELWRIRARGGAPRLVSNVGQGANFLAIARNAPLLAYSRWFADTNIWRYSLDGKIGDAPVALISSTRYDVNPQYSPDARRIAFRSQRSGSDEIWVSDADGTHQRALTSSSGPVTGTPRWSPDARWITFDSRPQGSSRIFVVSAAGGRARQLTKGDCDDVTPSWSADGKWIYFSSNESGTWQIWKVPADAGDTADPGMQITKNGGFLPFESADARFLYYARGQNSSGLYRMRLDGGQEELVADALKPGLWGNWALSRNALFWVEQAPDHRTWLFSKPLDSRPARRLLEFQKPPLMNESGLAVSADGASLLYAQADHSGSEIMLVEHFR